MATVTEEKYQGFTNYETFSVGLVLNNEEPAYHALRRIARIGVTYSERGDMLKQYVEARYRLEDIEGLAGTLVIAAMGRVNWQELIRDAEEK